MNEIQVIQEDDDSSIIPDFEIVDVDVEADIANIPTISGPPDMDAAVEVWIRKKVANSDPRPDTVSTYKNEIRLWFAWCQANGIHPADITKSDMETFRAGLVASGFAAATICKKLSIISRFYGSAVEDGYIRTNPTNGVKPPQGRKSTDKKKHLIKPEMKRLLNAIPYNGSPETLRDRAIIALEMIEGWRRVEIHRANVEDIEGNSHEGHRILAHGKTRDGFSYPENEVISVLFEYLANRGQVEKDIQIIHNKEMEVTPLFCAISKGGRGVRRLSRRGINFIIDKYLTLSGLKREDISCHALRYTCGYNGSNGGKDLRRTQRNRSKVTIPLRPAK